jgi:hypothetical protein
LKNDVVKVESEGKKEQDRCVATDRSEGSSVIKTGLLGKALSTKTSLVTGDAASAVTFTLQDKFRTYGATVRRELNNRVGTGGLKGVEFRFDGGLPQGRIGTGESITNRGRIRISERNRRCTEKFEIGRMLTISNGSVRSESTGRLSGWNRIECDMGNGGYGDRRVNTRRCVVEW